MKINEATQMRDLRIIRARIYLREYKKLGKGSITMGALQRVEYEVRDMVWAAEAKYRKNNKLGMWRIIK